MGWKGDKMMTEDYVESESVCGSQRNEIQVPSVNWRLGICALLLLCVRERKREQNQWRKQLLRIFGLELIRINELINELIKIARNALLKNRTDCDYFSFQIRDLVTDAVHRARVLYSSACAALPACCLGIRIMPIQAQSSHLFTELSDYHKCCKTPDYKYWIPTLVKVAASAAKFWKRDISSATEKAFPGFFGNIFGCSTPSKKRCFSTQEFTRFLSTVS